MMESRQFKVGKDGTNNAQWWPNQLNIDILHQHSKESNPLAEDFSYKDAFEKLDLDAVKKDIEEVMTTSQPWWPSDFGHYGPLFIRMAWHSAGTYRTADGRGGGNSGNQRFAPLNSWPDNVNLDKSRRVLWPVKQKYGRSISWADLMILAGNVALESMGFKTYGFGGGREDVWEPEKDVYWGTEKEWLDDTRHEDEELENPLAAVQMGLIYVNPEGPDGNPDPVAAAAGIRETFERMAMNDEETVALIAGGHSFGKCHGAGDAKHVGAEPEAAGIEEQGFGWKSRFASGKGEDTISSGLEVTWTQTPTSWSHNFFKNLFEYEWELTKSPAGAYQWKPKDGMGADSVPDAHNTSKRHAPSMLTTDLSLRFDPEYEKVARKFYENPELFAEAFAKAWFKLTHRDMGPHVLYLGKEVPDDNPIWQDPIPKAKYAQIDQNDIEMLKNKIAQSDLSVSQMVKTAWASASTYRDSDKRGGANGARVALAPQNTWSVNEPENLQIVLHTLMEIQASFNASQTGDKQVSLADMIVLAGSVGIERAAKNAGMEVTVPFISGRTDAISEQTDENSFDVLEPIADGFRNYIKSNYTLKAEELLVDRAQLLTLTAPEMTVLVGGLRVLGINYNDSKQGVLTQKNETLNNDFFINLLDMSIEWKSTEDENVFEGISREDGSLMYRASRVDLIFGSHSQLRALAELYASEDSKAYFVQEFIKAWCKVMNLDRFDLR